MSNVKEINEMVLNAREGSNEDIDYLLNNYRPLILTIVASLGIKIDKEDFIQEGYSAILDAIYTYTFENVCFDRYVQLVIEKKLNDLLTKYSNFEPVNSPISKINGENIYESEDSFIDNSGSLDSVVVCDGEISSVVDTLVSSKSDTEKEAVNNILKSEIDELFIESGLTSIEIEVLKYKYGFWEYCRDFGEIVQELGISRFDVEKISDEAIDKLRYSDSITKFIEYMDNPNRSLRFISYYHEEKDNQLSDEEFAKLEEAAISSMQSSSSNVGESNNMLTLRKNN